MLYKEELYSIYNSILLNTTIDFIAIIILEYQTDITGNSMSSMSKMLLNNDKNEKNKQVTIFEKLPKQQQQQKKGKGIHYIKNL